MMEYKGYFAGPIDFDPEENTFSGTVAGLRDVIHFEGTTAKELARAFRESIDSYLELCAETASSPTARSTERFWSVPSRNCTERRISARPSRA